jgi:two-component system, sensor histidine kinase and response regulator
MPRAFDEAELLGRVDHDWAFLGETVQMLVADGPALLAAVRQSADAGDATALTHSAHTLKGMLSNFCAPDATASALAVEQLGRAGDLSAVEPALQALEARTSVLIADLTDFVATRAS